MKRMSHLLLIHLMIVSVSGVQQLSLGDKSTSQGSTLNDHEAKLAVDGNLATYALSSSPNPPNNMAWWYVYLGNTYPVHSVQVWNAYNFDGGVNYSLETFDIDIITPGNSYLLCYRYNDAPFILGESKTFQCNGGPIYGSSVYFKKAPGGLRNELAIAEVAVYLNQQSSGQFVQVSGVTQSPDLALFNAGLAVDGDVRTYSVALAKRGVNAYAWWMADLGASYQITGVQMTVGPDYTSAQYMQSVSVDVSTWKSTEDPTFSRSVNCNVRSLYQLILPSTTISLRCPSTPSGRYVIVRRIPDGTFRTDIIALAEVLIEGQKQ